MRLITACLLGLLSANVCAEGCIVRANGKKICLDDTPPEQRAANDARAAQSRAEWDARRT